jgi:hypothetical protein
VGTFTWSTGLGLFGLGMLVIVVGGLIAYKIINYKKEPPRYY